MFLSNTAGLMVYFIAEPVAGSHQEHPTAVGHRSGKKLFGRKYRRYEIRYKKAGTICGFRRRGGYIAGAGFEMKRLLFVLGVVFALAFSGCGSGQSEYKSELFAMDTVFEQTVYADTVLVTSNNAALVSEIEGLMSKTIPTSDIYKVNHSMGHDVEVDVQTAKVVGACLAAAEKTGGAFSPATGDLMQLWGFGTEAENVPRRESIENAVARSDYKQVEVRDGGIINSGTAMLDLGGAVKGYTLDALRDNLDLMDAGPALINAGGSIYARGTKPDGENWKIGIRDPFGSAADYIGTMPLEDLCISTSGSYERGFTENGKYYHHILDPSTGYPAENGLLSVSVADVSGIDTDIYSTALFVMGREKGMEFAEQNGLSALFITEDKKLYKTGVFADSFELTDKSYEEQ